MEDQQLVQKARAGDRYAFNLLVWKWERAIYNLALRLLGSEDDAVEVCQEVFIRAYTHLKDFRGDARFSTWLYRIAINCCRNLMRSRKRRREVAMDFYDGADPAIHRLDATPEQEQSYHRAQMVTRVLEAMQALPEDQRTVIELRVLHDLGVEEVASIMGIPTGTVKSRLFYGLRKLRDQLQDLFPPPSRMDSKSTEYKEKPV